ncbi:MAG: thermonuclease family protein [Roseicyclus sp.]|nr:thermonuclease family protein [Roseicyclus sp.]
MRILTVILLVAFGLAIAVAASGQSIALCDGPNRYTCIVDGDTLWLRGTKYRLEGFDTPEPQTGICGGATEVALARQASARLAELLNTNDWELVPSGSVGGRGRDLATIYINGRDVGDILIAEGLARRWPDGLEFWCN